MIEVVLAPEPVGHPAVLVVDDDAGTRRGLSAMLGPLGYDVVEACSGRGALRAVLQRTFAVILMDVRMPGMDGYDTAKLIRERRELRLTPIIFITAYSRDETETASAYASGAVDFIFAPVQRDVLQAKVSAFVDLYLQSQELQRSVASMATLNAALRDSQIRADAVLQHVADGILTVGEGGVIESANRAAGTLFGYADDELIGRPLQTIVAPGHHQVLADLTQVVIAGGVAGDPIETVGCRSSGSCFPMETDLSLMEISGRTLMIGCFRDISARRAHTEALEHRALHDELTGLPNRTLFSDRIDRALAGGERAGEPRAVLVVDLDRFGDLRHRLGPAASDDLLKAVAERLRDAVHDHDTVARLNGHAFGILPPGLTDVPTAAVIAWKVRGAFERSFLLGGEQIDVGASVGIAFFPEHGRTADDLLRRADLAVRNAKQRGGATASPSSSPSPRTTPRADSSCSTSYATASRAASSCCTTSPRSI